MAPADLPVKNRRNTGKQRSTSFKKGNRANPNGRPKGAKNKVTLEAKALTTAIVDSPEYQKSLKARMVSGRAGAMEPVVWYYSKGKPKDTIEVVTNYEEKLAGRTPEEVDEIERIWLEKQRIDLLFAAKLDGK